MKCSYCQQSTLVKQLNSMQDKSVGSDCKPLDYGFDIYSCSQCNLLQKPVDALYHQRIAKLYADYAAYDLTDGHEQLNYSVDVPMSRCKTILENCQAWLPKQGRALDIGTGSGVMLSALSEFSAGLDLYGHDVDTQQRQLIEGKIKLTDFFSGSLTEITQKFDVITLIHVLEHIEDLESFLTQITQLLTSQGVLIVQVPNIEENSWDFAIFDHIWQFSSASLLNVVQSHFSSQQWPEQIAKEHTLILSNGKNNKLSKQALFDNKTATGQFRFHLAELEKISKQNKCCYVLGTGPSAVFTAHFLGDLCVGFVDEDSNKIGKTLANRPVVSIDSSLTEMIIVPYPRQQQQAIAKRLPHLSLNFLNKED